MPGPYENAPGAALPSSLGANPGAYDAAVEAGRTTDTATFLGNLLAQKQTQAKLAVASDLQSQIDLERAHQQSSLAQLKAKELEAQMYIKNAPAQQEATAGDLAERIRLGNDPATAPYADAIRAGQTSYGMNAQDYRNGDGSFAAQDFSDDTRVLDQRKQLAPIVGADRAAQISGLTRPERIAMGATDSNTAGTGMVGGMVGGLGQAPAPTSGAQDGTAPAAGSLGPAPVIPAVFNPDAPAAAPTGAATKAPLANAPSPGAATAAPSGPSIAPPPAPFQPDSQAIAGAQNDLALAGNSQIMQDLAKHQIPTAPAQGELLKKIGITTKPEDFKDPSTGKIYTSIVARDALGRVLGSGLPVLKSNSPAQEKIDLDFAAEVADYKANSGASKDAHDMASLDSAIATLRSPAGAHASGFIQGMLPEWVRAATVDQKALAVPNTIKTVLLSHLKELFGGRVSNVEVTNTIETAFNKYLDPNTNADQVENNWRGKLLSALEEKKRAFDYFDANSTLAGYKAMDPSVGKSFPTATPATSTSAPSAPASAPTSAANQDVKYFGGAAYRKMLNSVTGKYDWIKTP